MNTLTSAISKLVATGAVATAMLALPTYASAHHHANAADALKGLPAKAAASFPESTPRLFKKTKTARNHKPRARASHFQAGIPGHQAGSTQCFTDRSVRVGLPTYMQSWYVYSNYVASEQVNYAAGLFKYEQGAWKLVRQSKVLSATANENGLMPLSGVYWFETSGGMITGVPDLIRFTGLTPGYYAVLHSFGWLNRTQVHGQWANVNGSTAISCYIP